MARITEPSEPATTLPHQELNPLQNPLLAENINRWAEVYFTNPPDKRDAAVAELLAELEAEQRRKDEALRRVTATMSTPVQARHEEMIACAACGNENPVSHQFCGMCGRKVDAGKSNTTHPDLPELMEGRQGGTRSEMSAVPLPRAEELREEAAEADLPEEIEEPEEDRADYAPVFANSDLSLFQSFRVPHDEEEEEWEYGPERSTSYRFYIAVVLVIIIGGLGYMAWRGAQSSQAAHEVSPPPPAPATETAPPSAAASSPKSETAPAPSPESTERAASKTPAPARATEPAANPVVKASKTQPLARNAAPAHAGATGNGAEELAMAEQYLYGGSGRGRDSSEAAKWLWKSIAKHNGPATLMLADLYLRGDGVSKNCDQGRVLLDSAARRGIPGAGERLRNLQAFGCQ